MGEEKNGCHLGFVSKYSMVMTIEIDFGLNRFSMGCAKINLIPKVGIEMKI